VILRRLGNKKKIAAEIIKYFPDHKIYIEPFFGAGGMFFNKLKAKYNIVNDLDSDVFNLFQVVMNQKEELEKAFYIMPIHSDLLNYWKKNEETEPIKKALRFLFLSNLTLMGTGNTIMNVCGNSKDVLYRNINKTCELLYGIQFNNFTFEKFLLALSFRDSDEQNKSFIYSDPPYLDADSKQNYIYKMKTWTKENVVSLFDSLSGTGCKYAMSEFDHPFILNQAKQRNLNIHIIGERQNLKNRKTEILITNYKNTQPELFNV
jgi:DNA adenine methylase